VDDPDDDSRPWARTKVEHFHPQSVKAVVGVCRSRISASNDPATAWGNLLLCCNGDVHLPKSRGRTCDESKKDTHICDSFHSPRETRDGTLLTCGADGRLSPNQFLPDGAFRVVDEVLGLNNGRLVEARLELLTELAGPIATTLRRSRNHHRDRDRIAATLRQDARRAGASFPTVKLSLADRISQGAP
jgi:hypothetical protein